MSEISIEVARAGDEGVLLQLIRGLADYERLLPEVVTTEELLRQHLFGARPSAEALLARAQGEPVGFALYFTNFSTFLGRPGLYLEDLFVLPEHRGRGYGARLFRRVAQIALERECGRMEWSVLDWNEPALDFYRRMGAQPMSEWTVQRLTGEALRQAASGGTTKG
jgi:GNAT superfamily N-acetyltransferase